MTEWTRKIRHSYSDYRFASDLKAAAWRNTSTILSGCMHACMLLHALHEIAMDFVVDEDIAEREGIMSGVGTEAGYAHL